MEKPKIVLKVALILEHTLRAEVEIPGGMADAVRAGNQYAIRQLKTLASSAIDDCLARNASSSAF